MRFWLALAPYLAGLALYIASYRDLYEPLAPEEPRLWLWKTLAPVLTSALTPLVVAGSRDTTGPQLRELLSASVASILFVVVAFATLAPAAYFKMQVPLGLRRWEVPGVTPARILLALGSVSIASCAGVTLHVISQ